MYMLSKWGINYDVIDYLTFFENVTESNPQNSCIWFLNNGQCPICLSFFKLTVKLNNCQHKICDDCMETLCASIEEMPFCRLSDVPMSDLQKCSCEL
ncbi:unnamed protein product [Macrosiphum euphorbiae]|uniref:RING-type domain-containing protein n=1 Tax=Macrosiphum euphorbiae TaxID=13131 RepID=A0AAV0XS14_9HEMI|nr:unnamed protein product [Macrosiphum euphorbiae]